VSESIKRDILFVFGSQACVPADPLRAAKEMGCATTVLSSCIPCGLPDALVDRHLRADLNDFVGLRRVVDEAQRNARFDGVVCYDDQAVPVVARLADHLKLAGNPIAAADAARDKLLMKRRFEADNLRIAAYSIAGSEDAAVRWASGNGYPVVVKPLRGSASQGVIRADSADALREAYRRTRRIVRDFGLDTGEHTDADVLVEGYLPGDEFSVELLIQDGVPAELCVFEKPDPLVGPFFEETLYVTPTRLDRQREIEIVDLASRAVRALGLRTGVAHCELRVSEHGAFVLEVAARLIGGACSRVFRSIFVEDIHRSVIRLALGEPLAAPRRRSGAAGAMMLPIPSEGRLEEIHGTDAAGRVPGINDVIIAVGPGDVIVPFPEQSCYVGFLTASADTPGAVAGALRDAASLIELRLATLDCEYWSRSIRDHQEYVAPANLHVRTLGDYTLAQAQEIVVPIIAWSQFGELPRELALAEARTCVEWLVEGNRGRTSPACWLISDDRAVALGSRDETQCFASCLGVGPGHRNTGIGKALVRSVMAVFARQGCETMQIFLDPRNTAITSLCAALGFERETLIEHPCRC